MYVLTDRQTADIFTKPLGLDKLQQFSNALGLQHLDMPNLRGRNRERSERNRKAESDEEFDFGLDEEAKDGYKGINQSTSRSWSQANKGEVKPRKAER